MVLILAVIAWSWVDYSNFVRSYSSISFSGGNNDYDYPSQPTAEGEPLSLEGYTFHDAGLELYYNPVNAIVSFRERKENDYWVDHDNIKLARTYFEFEDYSNALPLYDEYFRAHGVSHPVFSTFDIDAYTRLLAANGDYGQIKAVARSLDIHSNWQDYKRLQYQILSVSDYFHGKYAAGLWHFWRFKCSRGTIRKPD